MMDWNSDPELQKIRKGFCRSLVEKKIHILGLRWPQDMDVIQEVIHSLAGTAGSFGFEALGNHCGELDDVLANGTLWSEQHWKQWLTRFEQLVLEVLDHG